MQYRLIQEDCGLSFGELVSRLQLVRVKSLFLCALVLLTVHGISRNVVAQQGIDTAAATRLDTGSKTVADTRYRIGPGDVLSILVRNAPILSGPVRVDQRGMIRLALIENEVQAACLTESELASQIATLYLEYKKNPSVDVFVTEFHSRPVAVIGAVNAPAQFRLQRQVRLLELLSLVSGPAPKAGRIINVIHTGGPNVCQANNSENSDPEIATYKLEETLKGKENANPFVQPGDIVNLPEADQVFIIGHVLSPQPLALRDKQITISRAIAMCGGPARDASLGRIKITRQEKDGDQKKEIYVDLKAVLKQKAEDIALVPNDIVEVPSSTGKTILQTIQGAIAPALTQLPIRAIP